jgi:hypothetical protein
MNILLDLDDKRIENSYNRTLELYEENIEMVQEIWKEFFEGDSDLSREVYDLNLIYFNLGEFIKSYQSRIFDISLNSKLYDLVSA